MSRPATGLDIGCENPTGVYLTYALAEGCVSFHAALTDGF